MENSINDRITQEYIDKYLECSRKVSYAELGPKDGVRTYYYDELGAIDAEGYPISSDYVLDGKAYNMHDIAELSPRDLERARLRYYYMPFAHELYVGTTGAGKTTGCVEPQLRAVAGQRNKPNLFFTDPKGELFDRNAEYLKEQGYRLYVLNFKDLARSDRWNPLCELYDLNYKAAHLVDSIQPCKQKPIPQHLRMACRPQQVGEVYFVYNGKVYADYASAKMAAEFDRSVLTVEVDSLVVQLVNMFITVQSKNDPVWEYGAQEALKGIIYAMLEDAATDPAFTRDMMTIKTMQDYYLSLRDSIVNTDGVNKLQQHPIIRGKSARVTANLASMFDNAPRTMRSYCGVFDNSMRDWFSGHIFALTTGNTVDLVSEDGSPFAIFVVTRDYEKSDFQVAGLFIDWVYRSMLEAYEEGRSHRPMHFMLDEFGNIPEIRNFENKIATARSRNIWFHLVVQSYKQMDAVYGEVRSCIIRDNCNSQVFLGSQNHDTKKVFAAECGSHYIPALGGVFNGRVHEITLVPLVPLSDIEALASGSVIIKRLGSPVIMGEYIRSYIAGGVGTYAHYADADGLGKLSPADYTTFTDDKYTYPKVQRGKPKRPEMPANPFRF